MAEAKRDQNHVTTLLAVSSVDGTTPVVLWADPDTHRLLVDAPAASFTPEIPAGVIDGSNTTFTFIVPPKMIVVDQSRSMIENYGWTRVGTVITLDVAPVFQIFGLY